MKLLWKLITGTFIIHTSPTIEITDESVGSLASINTGITNNACTVFSLNVKDDAMFEEFPM
jgi:hypothetical protein